jgi:hypothetical protein
MILVGRWAIVLQSLAGQPEGRTMKRAIWLEVSRIGVLQYTVELQRGVTTTSIYIVQSVGRSFVARPRTKRDRFGVSQTTHLSHILGSWLLSLLGIHACEV